MINEQRSVVVKRRAGYRYWLTGAFLTVAVSSMFFGHWLAGSASRELLIEQEMLVRVKTDLESSLDAAVAQIEILKVNNAIDSAALENVRKEMVSVQKKMFEYEERISFYRELLIDMDQTTGLSVSQFDLKQLEKGIFSYRWVIRQKTEKMVTTNIIAEIFVVGDKDQKSVSLPLNDLDRNVSDMPLRLKFKYFTIVQGVLELPKDFQPESTQLVLRYAWSEKTSYNESFEWLVES